MGDKVAARERLTVSLIPSTPADPPLEEEEVKEAEVVESIPEEQDTDQVSEAG